MLNRYEKNDKEALVNFTKALSINPKYMETLAQIVSLHVANQEFDTALSACDQQLEKVKNEPDLSAIVTLKGVYSLHRRRWRKPKMHIAPL